MVSKLGLEPNYETLDELRDAYQVALKHRTKHREGSVRWWYWNNRVKALDQQISKMDRELSRRSVMIDRRTAPATGPEREYLNRRLAFYDAADGVH